MKPILFCFSDDDRLAQRLAATIDADLGAIRLHRFPDGESLVTLQQDCAGRDVILFCTLTDADRKTLPLYFAATTARELGARSVGLVAPYLAYMRQDHRFTPGQSISAQSYAELLCTLVDWLVTVDPHLHRIDSLSRIFSIPTVAVSAMPAVAEWIRTNIPDPVIVGPDHESAQWVDKVAHALSAPCMVLEKIRSGDRNVKVKGLDPDMVGRGHPVVIDDISSSGHTLAEVLKELSSVGIRTATCVVVHGVFTPGAVEMLQTLGAKQIASTNTVPHPTNSIDIIPPLAEAVKQRPRR